MEKKIVYRPALLTDTTQIMLLLNQFGCQMDSSQLLDRIALFQASLHNIIVAEDEGIIVGLAAFGAYDHFYMNKRYLRLDTLLVNALYQDLGIEKQLMQIVKQYSFNYQCSVIEKMNSIQD